MSFYDSASLVFLPSGGAGKDGKAYSIKPVPEYGSELVTNGDFATDSDWIKGTGWTISGGTANCDGTQTGNTLLYQNIGHSSNTLYRLQFTISNYVSGTIDFALDNPFFGAANSNGTFVFDITPSSVGNFIVRADENFVGSIDNVSVKEITTSGDFTFSRGSNLTATRVDSNGLIAKGRENLLLQSNSFDTTWTRNASSVTSGQSGYDGSSDAWLLESDSDGAVRVVRQTTTATGINTFSVYAKAGSVNYIALYSFGANSGRFFDLNPSTTGSRIGSALISAPIDSKIEDVGGGWFRCSIVVNWSASAAWIYPIATDGSTITTTGDNIYIQDAQLEQGLVATEYIESGASTGLAGILEDSPRFDYSGGASCPSLLLEPQRSNIVSQSEYFADVYWSKANVDVDLADVASPEGKNNAYKVTETTAGGQHSINIFSSYRPNLSAGSHTHSCFVKANGVNDIVFYNNGSSGGGGVNIDLSDGTYSNLIGTATSASVEPYEDDWYRVSLIFTAVAGSTAPSIYLRTTGSYIGDGVSGIYIYGMQTEAGSYPTSYIPNHSGSGSVTRGADLCNGAGDASTFNDSEGVLYAEIAALTDDQSSRTITLTDGTFDERIQLSYYTGGSNQIRVFIKSGGTFSAVITTTLTDITEFNKIAYRYKSGETKLFINGSLIGTSADTFSITGLNVLQFANGDGLSNPLQGKAKQVIVFNTALSNTDLEILTGTSYESFAAMATALNYTTYE